MKSDTIPIAGIFGRDRHEVLEKGRSIFDDKVLDDLSCKHFKATTFEYPPVTTVNVLDNGTLV